MLTRLVRTQLIIFTIASVIGIAVMVFDYMQVPTLLGLGRITVKLELPASGGLYRFSNVTYRGIQVGKVTGVEVVPGNHVEATLSLDVSPKIPANLAAEVRSISAVGEQYVDLKPRTSSPPYLQNGSVIAMGDTSIPQQVGPMLDQVSALVNSIPKDKLGGLLDESFKALNGAGYDLGSLFDSSATVTGDLAAVAPRVRSLIDDSAPILDSQVQTADAIKVWARSLAGITKQVATDDPAIRTLLRTGPGSAHEVASLLNQIKPTLPLLLANLTSLGQVAVTYNPSLEQILVLLPPYIAAVQTYARVDNNPTGLPLGEFSATIADPPSCTVGFLPPSQWRSPEDTTTVDTPDGLYCKLPQDAPIAVRGARNYPCIGHPGKRAPTVQICDSDKPYEPLAMRQHDLGPYPLDPNLISQGIPPDDRTTVNNHIFGPVDGTPPPAGTPPPPPGAPLAPEPHHAPNPAGDPHSATDAPPPAGTSPAAPAAAPSGFNGARSGPSVALARYDPRTGEYLAYDGKWYKQSNLVATAAPKSWQDLLLRG
jgi:virulence factor Mce-like protein